MCVDLITKNITKMSALNIFLRSSLLLTLAVVNPFTNFAVAGANIVPKCNEIILCGVPKNHKFGTPNHRGYMNTWNEVLNVAISKLNNTNGLEFFWGSNRHCNVKIEYNNYPRSQYVFLPETTTNHIDYLQYVTKILSYEISQRNECKTKTTVYIPIKILPWEFYSHQSCDSGVRSDPTTKKQQKTDARRPITTDRTPTTNKITKHYADDVPQSRRMISKRTESSSIKNIKNIDNLDRIMAEAKYGHSK